ncbi:MAG: glycerol dehydrogenase [Chloroflexaceae bacterium]|jgi:glycerol dehydrogenase|nr:glycerol dehydrogenase [Chloroflexaceae bacterium]
MHAALIAPNKYVQGRGVMAELGNQVQPLGDHALVMADRVVWGLVEQTVTDSLNQANIRQTLATFGGEASDREIDQIRLKGQEAGANIVIGIGGGKVSDSAKAVGAQMGTGWVIVPTIASTDAPTSALSVIYSDEGIFERYLFHPKNPDLVLVDTAVIARAPVRFLAAGIGDGLSTWVEARANLESRKPAMSGGLATRAAGAIAKLCWDTLFTYGESAVLAVEQQSVTLAVEAVVEANTLLSGIGFESCGLAAAHAIHNGLTVLHHQTHSLMHGEKVAFGTISQLALEGRPLSEINELIDLCQRIKLPTTLGDLNLGEASPEELRQVAEAACAEGETIHNMPFGVTPDMVLDALRAADAYGRAYRERGQSVFGMAQEVGGN